MERALGKFECCAVAILFSQTIVADSFNRTTSQRLLGLLALSFGFRLVESDTESNVVVTFENRRCGFAAHIAINALAGYVKGSWNIFRETGI